MSEGRCRVRCFKANGCFKSSVLENLSGTAAFVLHICLSVTVLFLGFFFYILLAEIGPNCSLLLEGKTF